MMHRLNALKREERGAAAIEFAMVLLPLCILIMGGIEIGYRLYANAILSGALREASRLASTGTYNAAYINNDVTQNLKAFNPNANVQIVTQSYSTFTGVGTPEPIISGSIASGTYCYLDINGNKNWDSDQGTTGLGNPDEVVSYQVTLTYPTLFSFIGKLVGTGSSSKIVASTLLSNEPFDADVTNTPEKRCV
jgi:Flp pilus assembly protein TadG